ncbi:PREDICTED: retinoic acid receptor RXR-gamma isoform X2 [Cercocebus atys]|uniref:Retinoic acid receptor RXR n=1 Tax=Cercocebus atys TaxID=9531 RepID=A0A2K5KI49_CERAT|nr:PREDICTED: retinoic acid receptor RXR-gamma isoform X2 [Cercocebus atys]
MYGNYSHFMKFPAGYGGSPGHTGSTSMSPSAALSTGKPMDSHPSYTDTPVSAPRTLSAVGTPLNALGSPYRVITSAMGPPSGALAAPPGINLVAPPSSQLNVVNSVSSSEDIKPLPGLPGIGNMNYPSTSPGSLVKHICAICGDRSSAVQEERQRSRERAESEAECASTGHEDMPVERILEAELAVEPKTESYGDMNMENSTNDPVTNICHAADKQLFTLVEWAKRIPHFSDLTLEDQVILLRAGWNELLIASFSHRSVSVQDGILLATGLHVHRSSAHSAGVGSIFDRVLTELVSKMKDMQMDKSELGCLRAIVLFNPDAKGLSNPSEVETLREKVYATLEAYTKQKYPEQPGRFAKLLLRLPALRSIGLKCLEHLFFFKLIGDTPIDTFLMEMLETPLQIT